MSSGKIQGDINVENTASNINSYILGMVTMARIRNSLELLKDLGTGMFQIAGMRYFGHNDALKEKYLS